MYRRSITIGGGGGPPLSKNIVLGFAAILGSSSPLRYFVLDFEWANPAVQNFLVRPLDQEQNYLFAFKDTQIISYSNYRTLSVVMTSFRKYCRNSFRLIEEGGGGGDRPIIANSEKAAVSWIFSVSVFRTDLMSRQKGPKEVLITEQ